MRKNIIHDTRGMGGLGIAGIILGIIVILGVLGYVAQSSFQKGDVEGKKETGDCSTVPYVTITARDALNKGTAVGSPTLTGIANDEPIGTVTSGASGTMFEFGDKIELHISKADYLDTTATIDSIKCGNNALAVDMYSTDDSTIQIWNSAGVIVTDDITGGTQNQSDETTNINMDFKLIALSEKSSGDLVCVFEATNTSEIDDIVLSGATKVDVPEFYALAGGNSLAKAYEVPALIDGDSKTYNLIFEPETGQTMGMVDNAIYTQCYSKEWYVEKDGSFAYGVENIDGTTKYEDDFDYDTMISANHA